MSPVEGDWQRETTKSISRLTPRLTPALTEKVGKPISTEAAAGRDDSGPTEIHNPPLNPYLLFAVVTAFGMIPLRRAKLRSCITAASARKCAMKPYCRLLANVSRKISIRI